MIEVQNLEKKFGDFVAVDKINFSLQSGDILGFLGWCRKINNYEDTQWLFEPNKWYSFNR